VFLKFKASLELKAGAGNLKRTKCTVQLQTMHINAKTKWISCYQCFDSTASTKELFTHRCMAKPTHFRHFGQMR